MTNDKKIMGKLTLPNTSGSRLGCDADHGSGSHWNVSNSRQLARPLHPIKPASQRDLEILTSRRSEAGPCHFGLFT